MIIYISGALMWWMAWAIALIDKPVGYSLGAAIFSWLGLVGWELGMRENRKLQ